MSQIYEHWGTDDAFQINHTDKSFHVFAPSLSDKNNWLSNLKKFMAKAQKGQDGKVTECMVCRKAKFSSYNGKHQCRNCGKVVCSTCSSHKVDLVVFQGKTPKPGDERLERVCNECHNSLEKKSTNTGKFINI
ncbi:pleckstrin homology domain-containing family F member 2-like [Oscarella lobularis]|uniref:pleckstrin homology domain-containing family F member 2-like n=1 Tax=Oscarella lobularis TaxID=121494 RepID=UPI0033135F19